MRLDLATRLVLGASLNPKPENSSLRYKGISLNLLKNPLATAVSFLVNDLVKEALGYGGGGGDPKGLVLGRGGD